MAGDRVAESRRLTVTRRRSTAAAIAARRRAASPFSIVPVFASTMRYASVDRPSGCDSTKMHRSSPASKPHCAWIAVEELLVMQVPLAEVPPERHPCDELAVEPLVVLEALDRLRDEQRQRAAVQVHQAEAHDLADQPNAGRPVVEARRAGRRSSGCSS